MFVFDTNAQSTYGSAEFEQDCKKYEAQKRVYRRLLKRISEFNSEHSEVAKMVQGNTEQFQENYLTLDYEIQNLRTKIEEMEDVDRAKEDYVNKLEKQLSEKRSLVEYFKGKVAELR